MKFFYAKSNIICFYCKGIISRGDFAVRASYTNKETGRNYGHCYHAGDETGQESCYVKAWIERYNSSYLYWKQQLNPRKKIGRPTKCYNLNNMKRRSRLVSLMIYHRNLGHTERVIEIQTQIDGLERR